MLKTIENIGSSVETDLLYQCNKLITGQTEVKEKE